MNQCRRYRKKESSTVVAVQVDLETSGFTYRKWGGEQTCKPRDWLVYNNGDTYTVDREVFARTYRRVQPGQYVKSTPVWAEKATEAGRITTKEGSSGYNPGDYIVYNNRDGTDGYCMDAATFHEMYEPDEEGM